MFKWVKHANHGNRSIHLIRLIEYELNEYELNEYELPEYELPEYELPEYDKLKI